MSDSTTPTTTVHVTRVAGVLALVAVSVCMILWLSFLTGIVEFKHAEHAYNRSLTAEQQKDLLAQRMNERVGVPATEPIKEPVRLVIKNKSCMKVTKAYLDAGNLYAYVQRECRGGAADATGGYMAVHYQAKAPDGTIIASGYDNEAKLTEYGDVAEIRFTPSGYNEIPADDRIVLIEVWATDRP
jgi:hypothetical protein